MPRFLNYCLAITLLAFCAVQSNAQTTSTWNGSTGNWTDFTKWNTNPLFPNNGNGGFNYNAIINGGTVTVDQLINIENFTLGGGTLTRTNDLIVNQAFTWTGGDLSGTGMLQVNGSGSLSGNRTMTGGMLRLGNGTNAGTFNHTSGSFLILNNNGLLNIRNNFSYVLNSTVSSSFSSSITRIDSNSGTVGNVVIDAGGTFRKTGIGVAFISTSFTNNGTFDAQAGNLDFLSFNSPSRTNAGTVTIASGAVVGLRGGSMSLETGSMIIGSGLFEVSGGGTIVTANANNSIGRLRLLGSTINTNTGMITSVANEFLFENAKVGNNGVLNVVGGGSMALSGNIIDFGVLRFGDGVNAGTFNQINNSQLLLNNSGQLNIRNNYSYILNSDNISSTTRIESNSGTAGSLVIDAGGTFRKTGIGGSYISTIFTNNGAVDVQAGGLDFRFSGFTRINAGLITIASGAVVGVRNSTMTLESGSSITGSGFFVVEGSAANVTANASNSISRLIMSGGSSENPIFNTSAGMTTTITNDFQYEKGTIGGPGIMQINGNGFANLNSLSTNLRINNGTVRFGDGTNSGSFNHMNGTRLLIDNGGQINVRNNYSYVINSTTGFDSTTTRIAFDSGTVGSVVIDAGGTFRKTGTGLAYVTVPFTNSGTLEVAAGNLSLNGGFTLNPGSTIIIQPGANLNSSTPFTIPTNATLVSNGVHNSAVNITSQGALRGSGSVNGTVANAVTIGAGGTLAPGNSPGQITIGGGLDVGGVLELDITPGGTAGNNSNGAGTNPVPGGGFDTILVTPPPTSSSSATNAQIRTTATSFKLKTANSDTNTFATDTFWKSLQKWRFLRTTNGQIQLLDANNTVITNPNTANVQANVELRDTSNNLINYNAFVQGEFKYEVLPFGTNGFDLNLVWSPVPEPTTIIGIGLLALGGGAMIRRRMQQKQLAA